MEPIVQSARLPNGIRLPFVERGSPGGVPLVFLHGLTDSWRSFEGILARLPPGYRAIAPTMRGHAGADAPASGYRPQDFAGDVVELLDLLGIPKAVVCGHSFGSAVAQRVAIERPDRVRALVLLGSYTDLTACAEIQEFWDKTVSAMSDPIDPEIARAFQESTLARDIPKSFLEMVIGESQRVPARVWQATLRDGIMRTTFGEEIARIVAPTLILWGDRDLFMPREQQFALRAAIAGAKLTIYRDCGHALHWEEPDRVVADLTAFVEARSDAAAGATAD